MSLTADALVSSLPTIPIEKGGDPVIWDISLTYGELTPSSVAQVLTLVSTHCLLPPPWSFFDIGAGAGHPCLIAGALFPAQFTTLAGVEILPSYHTASLLNQAYLLTTLPEGSDSKARVAGIDFHLGDTLDPQHATRIQGTDVVFANATAFSEELLRGVFRVLDDLKPGALFICTSQKLTSPLFELCEERVVPSSWGEATVRVYRRRKLGKWIAGFGGRKK